MRKFNFVSMNNTDEPLLDFDETNHHQQSNQKQTHSQPPQYHRPNHDSQLISIDFKQPLQHQFAHDSSDNTISALTSHPTVHNSNSGHHTDNRRLLLATESGDGIDTSRHSPINTQNLLAADRHSLISLSSNSSETEDIVNVNAIEANVISNRDAGIDTSLLHPDDTVEVNLLADTSMDSRESQPLLGMGRDSHDFVHNNFPGKL